MNDKNLLIITVILGLAIGGVYYKKTHVDPADAQQEPAQGQNWDNWGPQKPQLKPEIKNEGLSPRSEAKPDMSGEGGTAATFKEATELAKAKQKPIFVFFTATWCQFCNEMKSNTLSNAEVKKALTPYIICFVDSEKDSATARQFKVKSVPSYFTISPNGQTTLSGEGKRNPQQFLKWLAGQG